MNSPKLPILTDGSSVKDLLRSLNFINVTDIQIMNGHKVQTSVHFPERGYGRCRWARRGCYTAIVSSEGDVYLRYGTDDITRGEVFDEVIVHFGCSEDAQGSIILFCVPGPGQQFDTEQLLARISGEDLSK